MVDLRACARVKADSSGSMKLSRSFGLVLLLLAGSVIQSPGQATEADCKQFGAIKARADKGDGEVQLSVAAHCVNGDGVARKPA